VTGTVAEITPVADSGGGSSVVSYTVVVALDGASLATSVLAGMSADVSVTTNSAADVIAVPALALEGASGSYAVRVVDARADPEVSARWPGDELAGRDQSGVAEGESVVVGSRSQSSGINTTQGGGFGAFPGGGGQIVRGQGGGPNEPVPAP
jgi:hypothetical protein